MLLELRILPLGVGAHISNQIAEALKIIEASGTPYKLTPSGTCLEGDWEDVLPLVKKCHDAARQSTPHVVTLLKIEDDDGPADKLLRNVYAVEEKVGHILK